MRAALILSSLLLSICVGCSNSQPPGLPKELRLALHGSPSFELISIDPEWHDPAEPYPADAAREHGYVVLGRTNIADDSVREQLIVELEQAAATPLDGSPACFAPRHLIRVQHAGKSFDLLICFQCWKAYAVIDGARQKFVPLSPAPAAAFDKVLAEAGIPIAP